MTIIHLRLASSQVQLHTSVKLVTCVQVCTRKSLAVLHLASLSFMFEQQPKKQHQPARRLLGVAPTGLRPAAPRSRMRIRVTGITAIGFRVTGTDSGSDAGSLADSSCSTLKFRHGGGSMGPFWTRTISLNGRGPTTEARLQVSGHHFGLFYCLPLGFAHLFKMDSSPSP